MIRYFRSAGFLFSTVDKSIIFNEFCRKRLVDGELIICWRVQARGGCRRIGGFVRQNARLMRWKAKNSNRSLAEQGSLEVSPLRTPRRREQCSVGGDSCGECIQQPTGRRRGDTGRRFLSISESPGSPSRCRMNRSRKHREGAPWVQRRRVSCRVQTDVLSAHHPSRRSQALPFS